MQSSNCWTIQKHWPHRFKPLVLLRLLLTFSKLKDEHKIYHKAKPIFQNNTMLYKEIEPDFESRHRDSCYFSLVIPSSRHIEVEWEAKVLCELPCAYLCSIKEWKLIASQFLKYKKCLIKFMVVSWFLFLISCLDTTRSDWVVIEKRKRLLFVSLESFILRCFYSVSWTLFPPFRKWCTVFPKTYP